MKNKELKDILNNLPNDAEVFFEYTHIVNIKYVEKDNVILID